MSTLGAATLSAGARLFRQGTAGSGPKHDPSKVKILALLDESKSPHAPR